MIPGNSQIAASQLTNLSGDTDSRPVTTHTTFVGNVFRTVKQHMSLAFGQLPNPMYHIASLPGQLLPAALLLSRAISAESKSMPLARAAQKADDSFKGGEAEAFEPMRLQGNDSDPRTAVIDRMLEDGGEADIQRIIRSIEPQMDKSRGAQQKGWASVPVPDDLNRLMKDSELTMDKKFVRTGFLDVYAVSQRSIGHTGGSPETTLYRFSLPGLGPNDVKQHNCNELAPTISVNNNQAGTTRQSVIRCKDAKFSSRQPKLSAELSNCFHTDQSRPSDANGLLRRSGLYLNSCPGALPGDSKVSGSMGIKIDRPGPATIFQIHSLSDQLLYRDSMGLTFQLSGESSGTSYDLLVADGMRFEPTPPASFAISIERGRGEKKFLAIKSRSDYSGYTNGDCTMSFNASISINKALCCQSQQQDVTYLHAQPLKKFFSKEWVDVKYEIDFTNYNNPQTLPGQVQVWVDGDMVVNARVFIGANDGPNNRYYVTYSLYDLKSETPVEIKFRDVKFKSGMLLDPYDVDYKPLATVTGQCISSTD